MSDHRNQETPTKGSGRNPERAYGAEIRYAKLCHNEKSLLRFYADVFYWEEARCSEWSINRISAHMGWTPKTTRAARNRLEELGWIVIHRRGYNKTHQIELRYGKYDPRYDQLDCAKWWKPEGAGKHEPLHVSIPVKGEGLQQEVGNSLGDKSKGSEAASQAQGSLQLEEEGLISHWEGEMESVEILQPAAHGNLTSDGWRHLDLAEW